MGRSCGNRHCPNCDKEKTYAWLEKQTTRLMQVYHFLVTFTSSFPAVERRWMIKAMRLPGKPRRRTF